MSSPKPHPVDVHVGARIRLRRNLRRATQTELAEALGLTFQQVQKYERGSNRISASMLYGAALFLDVPILAFFEGLPDTQDRVALVDGPQAAMIGAFLNTSEGVELATLFTRLSPRLRNQMMALIVTLADEMPEAS
ncbi:helix-turn-helix domain-containing protein [Phenylobacterium sp. 58.2.17]|uniref:helix-turn-helix domain-containing protein n=1 Tax=Phenylobacterium sp. 58.2.17 TaxID=2969306 RepID=UPI0022647076|nr:helix-turn-helix transcriptional regulator [Phenylobacterium sp. 58.2.17]MCX7587279.1 helix-turn-helix transcriptional regulator [Phenylobacterium sp. 58.2.17]